LNDVNVTLCSSTEEDSKRYHQNFLLRNNNEITACITDLLNSSCEEVYAVAFSKEMQQQTVGEVAISVTCFVDRSFLSATVKELLYSMC